MKVDKFEKNQGEGARWLDKKFDIQGVAFLAASRLYTRYVEGLPKTCNTGDRTFYDAIKVAIITFLILMFSGSNIAAAENEEISFLLSFIAESNCTFIRNGDEHPADKASEHLAMKYERGKRYIKTAEEFIDKIASKSSLSGKLYEVRCDDKTIPSGKWLLEALSINRQPAAK